MVLKSLARILISLSLKIGENYHHLIDIQLLDWELRVGEEKNRRVRKREASGSMLANLTPRNLSPGRAGDQENWQAPIAIILWAWLVALK